MVRRRKDGWGVLGFVCAVVWMASGAMGTSPCRETVDVEVGRTLTLVEAGNFVCHTLNEECMHRGLGNMTSASIVAGKPDESRFSCFGCRRGAPVMLSYHSATSEERTVAALVVAGLGLLAGA
jgi:hypothetical protein